VHQLLVDLRLDRLVFRHTMIDAAIVAKEVDKGTGLAALRAWVLAKDAETIPVGDDEPDLAMFRVATRSFAPANIGPRRQARLLGCQIASCRDQRGPLEIVGKIIRADNGNCERCSQGEGFPRDDSDLFRSVLRAADQRTQICAGRCYTQPLLDTFFARHSDRGPPTYVGRFPKWPKVLRPAANNNVRQNLQGPYSAAAREKTPTLRANRDR
jgi:hypothetical protein